MAIFKGATYSGPPKGYSNSGSKKLYVAIHNTANDAPPANEAKYAKSRTDKVSSHFYADPKTVIQSLDTKYDAWHAGSSTGNKRAIAWELTGTNSWSESYWRTVIDRIAPVLADVCRTHGITPRFLTAAQAKDGKTTGFVTHDDMRRFWGGTTHTDPGPNFPRSYLVDAVNRHLGTTTTPAKPAPAKPSTPATTDWTVKLIMSLPNVKRGSKGQVVKNTQGLLNAHGAKLNIDGDCGPLTDTAIRNFQRARKLSVDGIVGPATFTALITK
ncbi:peptidoglycan recognition protein family protein [Micromonospora avicenniae]|uniref:peptidoglycan recognition protein family protein n=1 Tax=Micromonospora avicenniae TaxID=1198245 RepID=UPI00332F00B1